MPDGRVVTGLIERVSRLAIGRCVGGELLFTKLAEADFAPLPEFAAKKSWSFLRSMIRGGGNETADRGGYNDSAHNGTGGNAARGADCGLWQQSRSGLDGARDAQRATDENVPIARAQGLPSLQGSVVYSHTIEKMAYGVYDFYPRDTFQANTSLNVPLYSGGGVRSAVNAAKTRVSQGQASFGGTETSVFSQVVAAYMDVTLNSAIVALNRRNVSVLETNLKATSDRFEIGDVTRTDVAQSNSRLAVGRATLRTAKSNLIGARERYIQAVGHAPAR